MRCAAGFVVFAVIAFAAVRADFPPPYNSEKEKGEPMPAAEAAARFKVPPGFRVSVFASEPAVQNPIACTWDSQGRLWVAENYTYAERPQKFDLNLRDRIVIFTDNGEGKPPERTVFCDDLQVLTSIAVDRDGVWVMCPPKLMFIPMRRDKPSGPPVTKLDGFTIPPGSYHNFANGLKWGRDGWLYGRCGASAPGEVGAPGTPAGERVPLRGGIWRYHRFSNKFEVLCHGTTNPWGHDWDKNGECFFINTVNGHLWHMIPGAHYVRSHTIDPNPYVYRLIDQHADHWHWDTSKDWSDSRKPTPGHDRAGGGHAHVGMMIYKGTQWPKEYHGKLFTLNFHGRRANVERLERRGSGFVGKHEPDMLFAADPFFRGQEITEGPNGDVFILDWSDTGECHEATGVHRTSGRIYRVRYDGPTEPKPKVVVNPRLAAETRDIRRLSLGSCEFNSIDTVMGPPADARYEDTLVDIFKEYVERYDFTEDRLKLASLIQRLPIPRRAWLASRLVARPQDAHDHNLPLLVWYGLIPVAKDHPKDLVRVMDVCTWPVTRICITRRLAEDIATRPGPLNDLLDIAIDKSPEYAADVVQGMTEGLRGWHKAPKPAVWDAFAARFPSDGVRDLSVLFGDGRALDVVRKIALDKKEPLDARKAALRSLIAAKPADLRSTCESLLPTQHLNSVAVKGLALSDDPAVAAAILKNWGAFHPTERGIAVDVLASRAAFAGPLLKAVATGKVSKADLTANHARQIASFRQPDLDSQLEAVWGRVRESPAEKKQAMAHLKAKLTPATLAKADLADGRALFATHCGTCHRLNDVGGTIGPDLTGSNRDNLDYLIENILDPSAVVTADFRVTTVALHDGRLLNGIVKTRTPQAITLQLEKEQVTVRTSDIESERPSDQSLMAEGILNTLKEDQIRNLFGYLMRR